MQRIVSYAAPPTLSAFHRSDAFVRGVMGPIGSGKSSAMCMELLTRAARQEPDCGGARRSRFAVVRNTYPELKSTTVKTWLDWATDECCDISWSAPLTARLRHAFQDGTRLDLEVLFLALDRPEDGRKLLSLELTGAWINEAREMPKSIVDDLLGRVGRFPPKRDGGPSWSGLFMDTNPPDDDHWWFKLAEERTPEGWAFFRQPPAVLESGGRFALSPEAENVANQPLGGDYWLRQVSGKARQWIEVYLMGRYGRVADGRPVYPEYEDERHLARSAVSPIFGRSLVLGWDFGLTPACVVTQLAPGGRLLVLAEAVAEDMGVRRFAREVVRPLLDSRFAGWPFRSFGDPAGRARAQSDERTCMDELQAAGVPTLPARTNDFLARREAVAGFLSRPGGLLVAPGCVTLRKGFLGGYRFQRLSASVGGGQEMYRDAPEKNRFSHVHDALQYAALAAEERAAPRRSAPAGRSSRAARPVDAAAGY